MYVDNAFYATFDVRILFYFIQGIGRKSQGRLSGRPGVHIYLS